MEAPEVALDLHRCSMMQDARLPLRDVVPEDVFAPVCAVNFCRKTVKDILDRLNQSSWLNSFAVGRRGCKLILHMGMP